MNIRKEEENQNQKTMHKEEGDIQMEEINEKKKVERDAKFYCQLK